MELDRPRLDEQYWLAHCQGFRVSGPNGFAGVVEEVRLGPDGERAEELLVWSGRLRLRSLLVRADDVAVIVPRETRLRLRHAPAAVSPAPHRTWRPGTFPIARGARA